MAFEASFKEKKVLVTGAARGLGRELVAKLYSFGAQIIALSKTKELLEKLENEFPGVRTICVDIGDWERTRTALMELEPVECIVNNAGHVVCKDIMHTLPEEFDRVYAVNTKGVMNVIQVMAGKLIDAKKPGSIVNVSTIGAVKGFPLTATYCASKAAMENMSKTLALELGPHKIRVNIVEPALMGSSMGDEIGLELSKILGHETYSRQQYFDVLVPRTPTQDASMPLDQVVNAILFMLSDLCPQMTGQAVAIDGGYLVT